MAMFLFNLFISLSVLPFGHLRFEATPLACRVDAEYLL